MGEWVVQVCEDGWVGVCGVVQGEGGDEGEERDGEETDVWEERLEYGEDGFGWDQ